MTVSHSRTSQSDQPDASAVKAAFARCFSIEDSQQRAAALEQLERDSPRIGAEVRLLLDALESNEKVEKVSAYVPLLDLSLARARELSGEESGEVASVDPMNASVQQSIQQTVASLPHVVLRSADDDEPVLKIRSSEVDQTWNKQDGRYRLDGEIARGGMGAILKGRDTDLGRDLAVKVLLKEHHDNPDTVKRFIEEAQIGGQLQHPGIAPVYELGQFRDQRPYFTMKLIKGKTLAALLAQRKSVDDDRAKYLGIFEQICQTMAYAHSRGVLHRDLKPSNVMVGAFGEVQVMDWGLAKVLAAGGVADECKQTAETQLKSLIQTVRSTGSDSTCKDKQPNIGSATRMGSILGTPAYMSPEQATGDINRLDQRADVFSLGSVLCEILTGDPAYRPDEHNDQLMRARQADTGDAFERLAASSADRDLVELAKACLAVDRDERPADAQAVSERVSDYLESVDQRLRETELEVARSHTKAAEERKRRRVVVALAACVMLAVTLGAGGWIWMQEKEAQLAQIKADAQVAAAEERSEREQQIQAELAAAAALTDGSEQVPSERELERAMEALRRADRNLAGGDVNPMLEARVNEMIAQVSRQQADLQLIQRLIEIGEIEQQYAAEFDIASSPDLGHRSADIGNPTQHYERAFSDWGLVLLESPQRDWLKRILATPATHRPTIIAALDRWRQLLDAELSLADWAKLTWTSVRPMEFKSTWGGKSDFLPDNSVLVSELKSGVNVHQTNESQGYEVILGTDVTEISALRLEALLDESLPNGGPGFGPGGMFDLRGLKISIAPRTDPQKFVPIEIMAGATDFSDVVWPFQVHQWRTWGGGGRRHVAFFRFKETIQHPDGFRIKIETKDVRIPGLELGALGRFRFSVAQMKDESTEKALLRSLLSKVDDDPWRQQLRKSLSTSNLHQLIKLASDDDAVKHQPAILIAQLANKLMSFTGRELKSISLDKSTSRTIRPKDVISQHATEYEIDEDGFITARGRNPDAEVTTIVVPAKAIESTTRLIRVEMSPAQDGHLRWVGRLGLLACRELAVTQKGKEASRNILSRFFVDYPFGVSLSALVDGDLETPFQLPNPDRPITFYLVLDRERLDPQSPIEVTLHTGSERHRRMKGCNPLRFRVAVESRQNAIVDPMATTEHLLARLVAQQRSDPLIHLQLAKYYGSSMPRRTADALRHAMIAGSLRSESILPSMVFVDSLQPLILVDNAPLRRVAIRHVRRVLRHRRESVRILRLRLALETTVTDLYSRGLVVEAEQLVAFALDAFNQSELESLFSRIDVNSLPVDTVCQSLLRCFERCSLVNDRGPELSKYCRILCDHVGEFEHLDQSLELARKSVELDPQSLGAHLSLGSILVRVGQLAKAADEFNRAIEIDPSNGQSHFGIGVALLGQQHFEEAFAAFLASVNVAENQAKQHATIGRYLAEHHTTMLSSLEGDAIGAKDTNADSSTDHCNPLPSLVLKQAIFHLQSAVAQMPGNPELVRDLGLALFENANWPQAVEQLEQYEQMAAEDYTRHRTHLFALAISHWRLGNEDLARRYWGIGCAWLDSRRATIAEVEKWKTANPDGVRQYYGMKSLPDVQFTKPYAKARRLSQESADLLNLDSSQQSRLMSDGYEDWLAQLEREIDWESARPHCWCHRGEIYFRRGQFEEALKNFQKALEVNPDDHYPLGWRGGTYHVLGRFKLSLADRTRSIQVQPWTSVRYFERAAVHRDMGNFRLALADLERGFQTNPVNDLWWFSRASARTLAGLIYRDNLNQNEKALQQFDRAIELDPNDAFAWVARAHTFLFLGQHASAFSDIEQSLSIDPDEYHAYSVRSFIHADRGRFDEALKDRNRAIETKPDWNVGYFERAEFYRGRREFDLALSDIRKGMEIDPDSDFPWYPRAKAYTLAGDIYLRDLGQPQQALEQYERALELAPNQSQLRQKCDEAAQAVTTAATADAD